MEEAIRKAEVLLEALAYIREFRDRLVVVKLGGSAMDDPQILRALLMDIVFMETVGLRPIVVHGGGKGITRAMQAEGITPRFVRGRRYTDEAALEVVVRVLVEEINGDLVRQLEDLGGRAVGLHYKTTPCLKGEKLVLKDDAGEPIDLGLVAEVTDVDRRLIENLSYAGVVPVIPSIAQDRQGQRYNVNADTAAAAVAGQSRAEKLVFLTDVPGILRDRRDPGSLASRLTADECRELIDAGVIDEGMIPKVEAGLAALAGGVQKVHVVDGRVRHSLLLEIYTRAGVGTEIVAAAEFATAQ